MEGGKTNKQKKNLGIDPEMSYKSRGCKRGKKKNDGIIKRSDLKEMALFMVLITFYI